MAENKRSLNQSLVINIQKCLLRLTKLFCLFPFAFNQKQDCFAFPNGKRLVYIVGVVLYQIVSTMVVLWLKIYRASIMTAEASRELAHLIFLVAVFVFQCWVFFAFWKIYKNRVQYLKIVNDVYWIYKKFIKIGVNVYYESVDHKFEIGYGIIFFIDLFFVFSGLLFYVFTLYTNGLLGGIGIVEAFSIVVVAPTVTCGVLLFAAGNVIVAHFITVIRMKVIDGVKKLETDKCLREFQFKQTCLEFSDYLDFMGQAMETMYGVAQRIEDLASIPMAAALFNIFGLIVSNLLKLYVCIAVYSQGIEKFGFTLLDFLLSPISLLHSFLQLTSLIYGPAHVMDELEKLFLTFELFEGKVTEERLEESIELFMIQLQHLRQQRLSILQMLFFNWSLSGKIFKTCIAYVTVMAQFKLYSNDE